MHVQCISWFRIKSCDISIMKHWVYYKMGVAPLLELALINCRVVCVGGCMCLCVCVCVCVCMCVCVCVCVCV